MLGHLSLMKPCEIDFVGMCLWKAWFFHLIVPSINVYKMKIISQLSLRSAVIKSVLLSCL